MSVRKMTPVLIVDLKEPGGHIVGFAGFPKS